MSSRQTLRTLNEVTDFDGMVTVFSVVEGGGGKNDYDKFYSIQLKLSDIITVSGLNNGQYSSSRDLQTVSEITLAETCANYTPLSQCVSGDTLDTFNAKIIKMNLFMFSSDRMNGSVAAVFGRYVQRLSLARSSSIARGQTFKKQ